MNLILEDRYESSLSNDTKKVPVALRLTSQWRFDDVIVPKKQILQIFAENMLIFKFSPKILEKCDFDFFFFWFFCLFLFVCLFFCLFFVFVFCFVLFRFVLVFFFFANYKRK